MMRSFSCKGSSSVSVSEAKSASRKAIRNILQDMTEKEEKEVPLAEYYEKKGKGKGKRFRSFVSKLTGKKKKLKVVKKPERAPAVAFADPETAGTNNEETSLAPLGVEDDDNDNDNDDDDGIVPAARSPPPPHRPVVRGGGAPRMPKRGRDGQERRLGGRSFLVN